MICTSDDTDEHIFEYEGLMCSTAGYSATMEDEHFSNSLEHMDVNFERHARKLPCPMIKNYNFALISW
jgi:hypothetical protein